MSGTRTLYTASATWHATAGAQGFWASPLAWGLNQETGGGTNGLLAEASPLLADRDAWFGRFEIAGKTAHDLDVDGSGDVFTVAKLQGGYTRYPAADASGPLPGRYTSPVAREE